MTTHVRKLLLPLEDHNPTFYSSNETPLSGNSTTSKTQERESSVNDTTYTPSSSSYSNFKLNPPFDSAMALTVLVLLTALFFMGFFSIYIRRFADESSVDPTRRRRGSNSQPSSSANTTPYYATSRGGSGGGCLKGVDPTVVKSLPVHVYFPGEAKQGIIEDMECAICLGEFEEKECVKAIPYCGHVFHVECIDTWLESHVTCPLCRTAKLVAEDGEKEVAEMGGGGGDVESGGGGGRGDTWIEEERDVGPTSERRSSNSDSTSSCVWFGERVRLHRSLSF